MLPDLDFPTTFDATKVVFFSFQKLMADVTTSGGRRRVCVSRFKSHFSHVSHVSLIKIYCCLAFSASKMSSTTSQILTVDILWPRPFGIFSRNIEIIWDPQIKTTRPKNFNSSPVASIFLLFFIQLGLWGKLVFKMLTLSGPILPLIFAPNHKIRYFWPKKGQNGNMSKIKT